MKYYYQFKHHCLLVCKAVFHALLYIVDLVEWLGRYSIKFLEDATYIFDKTYVVLFLIDNRTDVRP